MFSGNCQNCNFPQIRLLGLKGPYTRILVDGQPVVSSLAQVYGIEQIPARMIERIEVVKGGGSALYWPCSVGGVVNVISREPTPRGTVFETRTDVMHGAPGMLLSGTSDEVSSGQERLVSVYGQVDRVAPLD